MTQQTSPSLRLGVFTPAWGLASVSPFCLKADTFMKMSGLNYEAYTVNGPPKTKSKKLPCLETPNGLIEDSENIIAYCKDKHGIDLDHHLNAEQLQMSHFVRRTFEDAYYFSVLWERWCCDENWPTTRKEYFSFFPPIIKTLVPNIIRRGVIKDAYSQGTGRRPREEIIRLAKKDLDFFSDFLGEKSFFLGDRESTLDATAYGFLAGALAYPIETPIQKHLRGIENLCAYVERVKAHTNGA